MVHATRKTLEEAGDKASAEEKETIEKAIADVESAIKTGDKDDIEAKTKALTEASSSLAQKLYAEKAQAESGPQAADNESKSEDDAVDAEFEEVKDDK